MRKEYPISDDIVLLNDKSKAAEKLVKIAMRLPFGYRKALKASTDAVKFDRLFWQRIRNVYSPELDKEAIAYDEMKQIVYIVNRQSLEAVDTAEPEAVKDIPK